MKRKTEKVKNPYEEKEFRLFLKQLELVLGKAKINLDIIDSKFNIRHIDSAWKRVYGEPAGKKCFKYFMGRSKACPRCGIVKALKTKKLIVTEEVLVKENNRPIQVTTIPFRNGKGEWLVAEVNVDISARKKIEALLRRDKEALEELVSRRTAEALEAQAKLERAKRLSDIGELAATVAHELRNPLAAIRTAAYNIRMESRDPSLGSHLANIEKKVLESDQIINNLLFYSNIRMPQFEKVDACVILNECIADSRIRFPEYDVLIQKTCPDTERCIIEADPLQIEEVFTNILNNAYESFRQKKGRIEIVAGIKRGGNLRISFKDNGAGIECADLKMVFEPFFTRKSKGTGLGLVVCNEIVRLHNGRIEIKSRRNIGTNVTVELPVKREVKKRRGAAD